MRNMVALTISPLQLIRISLFGSQLFEAGAAVLAGSGVSWHVLALALLTVPSFLIFHFFPSWILIGWVAYNRGIPALLKEPVALYSLAAVMAGALVSLLFSLSGGAVYYFSNVAFFVALPVLVELLTRQLDRRRVTNTVVLLFGVVLLVGSSWRLYYHVANTRLPVSASRPRNPLVESLLRVRDTLPINVVMQADPAAVLTNNPAKFCAAVPLMFPAVSERPWICVIPARDDCRHPRIFTYGRYGITDSQQVVTMKPRLLPGMTIHHWPPAPQDADAQFRE